MPEKFSYRRAYSSSPYIRKAPGKFRFNISMTLLLIIINIVFFLIQLIIDYSTSSSASPGFFTRTFGLMPSDILQGKNLWALFTNMFLHGGFFHLAANMISLMFVGSFLEKLIGKKKFMFIYLISGIVASLFFVFLSLTFGSSDFGARIFGSPGALAVGASGAIFGLSAVLMILTPKVKVYIMFIPIAMPLWLGMLIMLFGLWILSAGIGLPVGNSAHLGGFLTGMLYGIYLRRKYKRKVRVLDKYFSQQ